ncbi:hypothetical protein [Streptomyces paludis]|uniref:hypothetical protein n=1 Tax=Streptomyces paludis TaxID=2282738 RepID=UPI0015F2BBC9|nr:hypothetical protein [Streptomyces paludis]
MLGSSNSETGKSRSITIGLTVATLIVVPVLAVTGGEAFRAFIDFGAGVLSLLSLSGAVVWGLIATDRLLLSPRHRLVAQGIHRATAVSSLGFLLLHVSIKISLGKVALIGALLPFGLGITGTSGLIGFGSMAGLLMIVAATTGAMRSVMAPTGKFAYKWRAMHMLAYPAWCFAMVHGLFTGRPAATYVTVMYSMVMLGVAVVVAMRLLPRENQQRIAEGIVSMTGGDADRRESQEYRRDLSSSPLPGAMGVGPQRDFQPRRERESAGPPSMGGNMSFDAPRQQPRLPAPSPPLYEATPRPMADPLPLPGQGRGPGRGGDPMSDTFAAPRGGESFGGGSDSSGDSGTGLSAGYRAAQNADATARMPITPDAPGPGPGPSTGSSRRVPPTSEIPLAERVLMTDEIPVIQDEPTGRGGSWPAPMPPPPARSQAFVTPPQNPAAPMPYDTGATPAFDPGAAQAFGGGAPAQPYDTGATPQYEPPAAQQYDRGRPPPYDPDAPEPYEPGPTAPQYNTGSIPVQQYDTGAMPQFNNQAPNQAAASPYGPDGASPYGTTTPPSYDTGSLPPYTPATAAPYDTGAVPAYDPRGYPGQPGAQAAPDPYAQPSAFDGSNPVPGPVYQPPAGEPWNAPAGDRP